ncbi:uncharacterized protein LOC135930976 [Gordionus sp. m RMFG-2023]|uniref:uncharacterized protein LOC135930976 n=1 Tax=Gordionus sp. m RMFG-2023 TaxID=3053472 RepID=UPI0031FCE8E4
MTPTKSCRKCIYCNPHYSINTATNLKQSLTTDLCTGINSFSYLSITIHYIDNDWKFVNLILDFIELPHPHTGAEISESIQASIESFKIHDKVMAVTHDNAKNMIAASRILSQTYTELYGSSLYNHRCLAHIINIIVGEGMIVLNDKLQKINKFVKKLHTSPKYMKEFLDITGGIRIPLDVVTRWNSKFLMISSINKNLDAVNKLGKKGSHQDGQLFINNEESIFLKDVEDFLKHFYKITLEASSATNTTIGSSLLFINCIENILNHYITGDTILKNTVESSASENDILDIEALPFSVSMHNSLRKGALQLNDPLKDEISLYLKEDVASPTTNVLEWWSNNNNSYPNLSLMAKDFLAQQTTSVASERIFSKAVECITKKRNKMLSTTLKHCISLNCWEVDIE